MSTDGQGTKWRRNIAENFNGPSRMYKRYRDRRRTGNNERELTLKNQLSIAISPICMQSFGDYCGR